jgi:hypothetical protein
VTGILSFSGDIDSVTMFNNMLSYAGGASGMRVYDTGCESYPRDGVGVVARAMARGKEDVDARRLVSGAVSHVDRRLLRRLALRIPGTYRARMCPERSRNQKSRVVRIAPNHPGSFYFAEGGT